MTEVGVDALFVASTDRYLNEYVPKEQSFRQWLTGFTGSTADALIVHKAAYIAVDGRYWLQAEKEVDKDVWSILQTTFQSQVDQVLITTLLEHAQEQGISIGFAAESMTPRRLEEYQAKIPNATWVALDPSPAQVLHSFDDTNQVPDIEISVLDEGQLGVSAHDKLQQLTEILGPVHADALLVQRLDQLMWLSNLRGNELPFQATFTSIGLVTPQYLYLGVEDLPTSDLLDEERPDVRFVPEEELWAFVGPGADFAVVAYDPAQSTVRIKNKLQQSGAKLVEVHAPLDRYQSRKSAGELRLMTDAFHRADIVMEETIRWVNVQLAAGEHVTEARLAEEVHQRFLRQGATGLSFPTICAAGQNGAVIHYGPPSHRRRIASGELVLIDAGAYFEAGYATDLTRTFLVGMDASPTESQRTHYTLVLKAAIAGMTAVLPEGARGAQLDALVRAPLWAVGLDYNHGTGHGVGINVHEYPPRIGSLHSSVLEIGQVFSIEPGYYEKGFGGVRIENLCTLEPGPQGFMQVVPLTFAPLDTKLIAPKMLTFKEKAFLRKFKNTYNRRKKTMKRLSYR